MSRLSVHPLSAAAAATVTVALALGSPAVSTVQARQTSAAATSPAAKKPTPTKKPVAKKPVAKKPVAKKPVAKTPSTARAATTATFVSRSTALPRAVKDGAGNTWGPRTLGWGTWNRSDALAGKPIDKTADDAIYRANAWGISSYRLDVPAKATYRVRLLMAEDFFGAAGKRVFDVVAEGKVVARGVDIYRAVGKGSAYVVTADVPVSDGRLDLTFVAKADKPLLSAVEVRSTTPVAARSTGAVSGPVPVSPRSFFRQSVRSAPLATNSARTVALLAADARDNWGGNAAFNAYSYNSPVYRVPANQPKVRVGFNDCQGKKYTPANLFTGKAQFLDVPVPANAVPATGTDAAMTIHDPAADKVWEFWQMRKAADGTWSACWGGRIDKVSTSQGVFDAPYGSTASGIMLGAGMITADEIRRGRIDHAIPLVAPTIARWDRFSWPANRSDGNSTNPDAVMEGQRLRLDPSIDVASLDLTPVGQIVARAAQEYGFVVVDKSGAVSVIAESGEPERARTGTNPWDLLLAEPSHRALKKFPWDRLQALPRDYGRP